METRLDARRTLYEFMAVDTVVDDEGRGNDGSLSTTPGKSFRVRRNLEGSGYFMQVDVFRQIAVFLGRLWKRNSARVNPVAVPAGVGKRDALAVIR